MSVSRIADVDEWTPLPYLNCVSHTPLCFYQRTSQTYRLQEECLPLSITCLCQQLIFPQLAADLKMRLCNFQKRT